MISVSTESNLPNLPYVEPGHTNWAWSVLTGIRNEKGGHSDLQFLFRPALIEQTDDDVSDSELIHQWWQKVQAGLSVRTDLRLIVDNMLDIIDSGVLSRINGYSFDEVDYVVGLLEYPLLLVALVTRGHLRHADAYTYLTDNSKAICRYVAIELSRSSIIRDEVRYEDGWSPITDLFGVPLLIDFPGRVLRVTNGGAWCLEALTGGSLLALPSLRSIIGDGGADRSSQRDGTEISFFDMDGIISSFLHKNRGIRILEGYGQGTLRVIGYTICFYVEDGTDGFLCSRK